MADVGKPSYAFSVLYCLKMLRSQKSNRAVMSVPQVVDSETCFAVTCWWHAVFLGTSTLVVCTDIFSFAGYGTKTVHLLFSLQRIYLGPMEPGLPVSGVHLCGAQALLSERDHSVSGRQGSIYGFQCSSSGNYRWFPSFAIQVMCVCKPYTIFHYFFVLYQPPLRVSSAFCTHREMWSLEVSATAFLTLFSPFYVFNVRDL